MVTRGRQRQRLLSANKTLLPHPHRLVPFGCPPSPLILRRRPEDDLNEAQSSPRPGGRHARWPRFNSQRTAGEVVRAHTHTHTIRGHPHPTVYCKVPPSFFSLVSGIPAVSPVPVRSSDRVRQILYLFCGFALLDCVVVAECSG
ncbi:hypothetical protein B0T09DRAFT_102395 [Sordaria sp. MPI-SDFR-AT-0083]|nr:hypothetical protein B0T09DRAFT_102395 [Sordaria sp. MPI-SDFR-AT-0083]